MGRVESYYLEENKFQATHQAIKILTLPKTQFYHNEFGAMITINNVLLQILVCMYYAVDGGL